MGDVHSYVDAFEGFAGPGVPAVDEAPPAGFEKTGRIDEDNLGARAMNNAVDGFAGGLGFGADDGDLRIHQRIEQGGFARIGPAYQGHHAGAKTFRNRDDGTHERGQPTGRIPAAHAHKAPITRIGRQEGAVFGC